MVPLAEECQQIPKTHKQSRSKTKTSPVLTIGVSSEESYKNQLIRLISCSATGIGVRGREYQQPKWGFIRRKPQLKTGADCGSGTSKTPLWQGGPAGQVVTRREKGW
jgi:hypothetical protein